MVSKTEKFIDRAQQVHGNKYDYSRVVYVNAKTKVDIICPKHGVFKQTPDNHTNGKCGCPMCAGNVVRTNFEFVEDAMAKHGIKYDYSKVNYVNNKTKVCIICSEHGEFWQTPENHLSGQGCPSCANNMRLSSQEFVEKAKLVHGDRYDYSKVVYQGNKKLVEIVCHEHGSFNQRPDSHLSGAGCPVCGCISSTEHHNYKDIYEKSVCTFLKNYGVTNPMYDGAIREKHLKVVQSDIVNDKRVATKRANNSFNTSLLEYRLGVLLDSVFGESDVIRQYSSKEYPFACDFYIQSRDLYIELNAYWSHGGHWYCDADKCLVDKWMLKSKFYQNAALNFSVRDVKKRQVARDNHLNYVVFWKSDLSDVKQWIDCGCPDGTDWDKEYSWLL